MATYNGAPFLEAQLESILSQTTPPAEIIVSDDHSQDGTIAILERYERRGLLRFAVNDGTPGVTGNFQNAVRLARPGNFIAFADQDDSWLPQKLALNRDALLALNAGDQPALIFSDATLTNEHLQPIAPSLWGVLGIDPAKERFKSLLFGNIVTGCTVMMNDAMRRRFLAMPLPVPILHDGWMGLIAFSFGRVAFLRDRLVCYRQHGGNVTGEGNKRQSFRDKLRKNMDFIRKNDAFLASEIAAAEAFLNTYRDVLSAEHQRDLQAVISLRDATFLRKKMAAISARAYRLRRVFGQ